MWNRGLARERGSGVQESGPPFNCTKEKSIQIQETETVAVCDAAASVVALDYVQISA